MQKVKVLTNTGLTYQGKIFNKGEVLELPKTNADILSTKKIVEIIKGDK